MAVEKPDLWDRDLDLIRPERNPARPRSRFRPKILDVLVVIAIVGILAGLILPGLPQDRSPVFPPKSGRANDTEIVKIAGEFYLGDGLGSNWHLNLTRDGRYSFVSSGCVGVGEKDCGYVRMVNGRICLSPSKPSPQPRRQSGSWLDRIPNGELRIIRWGPRVYLIPDDKVQDFCLAVSQGREPRPWEGRQFLLREIDLEKPTTGLPDVPESWTAMLPKVEPDLPLPHID